MFFVLFSGSGKGFFNELVKWSVLDDEKMVQLTKNIQNIHHATNSRWIPTDIGSKYKYYNSYQWKEFTLSYSMIAYKGVIPREYLECWGLFVKACRLICQPVIRMKDAEEAHNLFKQYGTQLEELFGSDAVKPNHHFHCHLMESIFDYGSPYSFWLFPFERYNGDLGKLHTNNKEMELTLFRKFTEMSAVSGMVSTLSRTQKLLFSAYLRNFSFSPADIPDDYEKLCNASCAPLSECETIWKHIDHINDCLKKHQKSELLDEDEQDLLKSMYQTMYPNNTITRDDVGEFYYSLGKVYVENTRISALGSDRERHCFITAYWPDRSGLIDEGVSAMNLGRIKTFWRHTLKLNGTYVPHILCVVDWKEKFEDPRMEHGFLSPVMIYRNRSIFRGQSCGYMPVQRIHSICVHSYQTVNGFKDCIVAVPNRFHLLLNDM